VKLNAKFVKQMLIELDLDQQGLAARSGLSEITVSRLMQGKAFNSETLGKLATALGCHPVDLIEAKGFASPHMVAPAIATLQTH
jgi:DNA-binding Xre family transcriptional regulator